MKKIGLVIAVLASLLALAGIASAYMGFGMFGKSNGTSNGTSTYSEMEKIMEEGAYSDLVEYRQKTGLGIMPWIDTDEEFKDMQEMHNAMEKFHEKYGMQMQGNGMMNGGMGMMHGSGAGMGGCPMMG